MIRRSYCRGVAFVLAVLCTAASPASKSGAKNGVTVNPKTGREGTTITITYPTPIPAYPLAQRVKFYDAGVHGWVIVHGAGDWVQWDPRRGLIYTAPGKAVKPSAKRNRYTAVVPYGICGIVIKSKQSTVSALPTGLIQSGIAPVPGGFAKTTKSVTAIGSGVTRYPGKNKPAKNLEVWLDGRTGRHAAFGLLCDAYTMNVKVKAKPKKIQVPPAGSSVVTATFTIKGPAQFLNGKRIVDPRKAPTVITPFKNLRVYFKINPGKWTLVPAPGTIVLTGPDGRARATVTSGEPGRARIQAIATGLGDGHAFVTFVKKKIEPPPAGAAPGVALATPGPAPADAPSCGSASAQRAHPVDLDISHLFLSSQNGELSGSGSATRYSLIFDAKRFNDRVDYVVNRVGLPTGEFWDEDDFEDFLDYVFYELSPRQQECVFTKVLAGASWHSAAFNDSGFKYSAQGLGVNAQLQIQPASGLLISGTAAYYPANTTDFTLPGGQTYQYSSFKYDIDLKYRLGQSGVYVRGGFYDEGLHGKNSGGNITNYGPYLGLGVRF